jgi:hypothetical protein
VTDRLHPFRAPRRDHEGAIAAQVQERETTSVVASGALLRASGLPVEARRGLQRSGESDLGAGLGHAHVR